MDNLDTGEFSEIIQMAIAESYTGVVTIEQSDDGYKITYDDHYYFEVIPVKSFGPRSAQKLFKLKD